MTQKELTNVFKNIVKKCDMLINNDHYEADAYTQDTVEDIAELCNDILDGNYGKLVEVKNVKKESVSDDLEEAICQSFIYHERRGDDFRSDKQIETAYKYGFETGVKWANEHSIEVKEVDLNKEIKDYFNKQPIITRSKGIDYQLIPSGEEIAKHFFELGLRAQKGE